MNLNEFHHSDKNGNLTGVYDYQIFKYLIEELNILVVGGIPYIYSGGVYRPDYNGAKLKTEIRKLILPQFIRSTTIERIYKLFLSAEELQSEPDELNRQPSYWINFRNGFFDPIKKEIVPHSPIYRAVNQIPIDYDPRPQPVGENVEKWLQFITPDTNDREMLLEFIGYAMTSDIRQQKFLILCGTGGSGKSTLIRMIENIVGAVNISHVSLKELSSQRFASFGLMGKTLNTCADLEVSALEDVSILKKILGEDAVRAESKGKDAISFRSRAKLIFSTNELPIVLNEKTNGFYRRLLVLNMNRTPEKPLPNFLDSLETDYFVQIAVHALERMYERGTIIESENSKAAVKQLRGRSDSVQAWLDTEMTKDPQERRERAYCFNKYESFCIREDRQPLKKMSFLESMRAKEFKEKKSNGTWYFLGITDRPKDSQKDTEQFPEEVNRDALPF